MGSNGYILPWREEDGSATIPAPGWLRLPPRTDYVSSDEARMKDALGHMVNQEFRARFPQLGDPATFPSRIPANATLVGAAPASQGPPPAAPPAQPSPPPAAVLPQPQSPPPQESSASGFWGGLLDVLKNVPLSGGGRRSQWQLPSYNQMTAGKRTLDFAKSQGMDVGQVGSVSPAEAEFRVQHARIGPKVAERLVPLEANEPPERQTQRAWIEQLPYSALAPLVAHQVQQYGLPGWGGGTALDPTAGFELPATAEAQAPPAAVSPSPAPVLAQPGPSPGTPPTAPPSAPSTAPLVQPAAPLQAAGPAPAAAVSHGPALPDRQPTLAEQQRHSDVVAAETLYRQQPTLQNRALVYKARAAAADDIRKQRHQQYGEQSQAYRNQLAEQTALRLAQKAYQEALRMPYGYGEKWDAQLRLDYADRLPPGAMPQQVLTKDEIEGSRQRAQANQAVWAAQEAGMTKTATMTAEQQAKLGWPVTQALGPEDKQPWDTTLGAPVTKGTLGEAYARQETGDVQFLDRAQVMRMQALQEAAVAMRRVNARIEQVYNVVDGYLKDMSPAERANPLAYLEQYWARISQEHPELLDAQREIEGSYMAIATGLMGGDKRVSMDELKLVKAQFPNVFARMDKIGSVSGRVGNWMTGSVAASLPFGTPELPDTPEVARSTMDSTMGRLNDIAASVLQKPGFQFAGVTPRTEAERTEARRQYREQQAGREAAATAKRDAMTPREKALGPAGLEPVAKQVGKMLNPPPSPLQQTGKVVLRQLGLDKPPSPQDTAGFATFMAAVHAQLSRDKTKSPAEVNALTATIAQRMGGTWQPPR